MSSVKICIAGVHGVGKSRICEKICANIVSKEMQGFTLDFIVNHSPTGMLKTYLSSRYAFIPEQFREIVTECNGLKKQTEEITLATYAKQLYLENLYTAQGKNILCDRSVLDTFVYYDYFNSGYSIDTNIHIQYLSAKKYIQTYSKIYLIEPSDREIENDGFRMTDKKQQLEIHKLFLEYFKDFHNVEIINQEDAHKPEFIEKVIKEYEK